MMFSLALLMYYSPDLVTPCPRWVYFVWAICLFAYQSLDAIDGKQARRTGSSSPLGELFDQYARFFLLLVALILKACVLSTAFLVAAMLSIPFLSRSLALPH